MKPEDYTRLIKKLTDGPEPVDYNSVIHVCSDKPFATEHRLFYRMTSAKFVSERGLSHGGPAVSEQKPLIVCATCGALAYQLNVCSTVTAQNTQHYTPGELVIFNGHTSEQRKAKLMIVVGYTPEGNVKTRYVYEKETWWAVHKKGDALQDDEFYENPISALQPANHYIRTQFWLEGMSCTCPDYDFEEVVNVYDLQAPLPTLHPFWKLVTEASLDKCKDDYERRHGLGKYDYVKNPPAPAGAKRKEPELGKEEGDEE